MTLLEGFQEMFVGATVTAVTFDGETYRAELSNGEHIAFDPQKKKCL